MSNETRPWPPVRRTRKKRSPLIPILVVILAVVLVLILTLHSCGKDEVDPQTPPVAA